MSAIGTITRARIKAHLEVFIENLVRRYRTRSFEQIENPAEYLQRKPSGNEKKLRPFHAAIIPPELRRVSAFERGFSTSLGTTFEECARLIAADHHKEAHRGYRLTGDVSQAAIDTIEHQVSLFEHAAQSGSVKPSLEEMIEAVLAARSVRDQEVRSVTADLFILTHDGREYYFEMKSPDANKGQCLEVTQRILRFHLIRGARRPDVFGYLAMAYNPDGPAREDYRWSFVLNYMPFDQAVIIGQEFWNLIGGSTAFEELLTIYQEVGREKAKFMIDALAFGF